MNKYIGKVTGTHKADEALEKLKKMVEEAKKDPEKMSNLNKAMARTSNAGIRPGKWED